MKKLIGLLSLTALLAGTASPVSACYGVRAMGMGGAFIAVADDVNTVYWNPAGLADLQQKEFAIQRIGNNRDVINYLDVWEFAMPLKEGKSGIGLHYVNDRQMDYLPIGYINNNLVGFTGYDNRWWVLSYGQKVNDHLSLGINARRITEKISGFFSFDGNTISTMKQQHKDSNMGYDLSALYRNGKWSASLLIQDVNKPDALFGLGEMTRNWRPGFAYRPNDRTIIAFDVYDATNEYERDYCMGIEYKIDKNLTARIGNYQGAMTYGVGAKLDKNFEINYAFLAGNLANTSLIGLQTKF